MTAATTVCTGEHRYLYHVKRSEVNQCKFPRLTQLCSMIYPPVNINNHFNTIIAIAHNYPVLSNIMSHKHFTVFLDLIQHMSTYIRLAKWKGYKGDSHEKEFNMWEFKGKLQKIVNTWKLNLIRLPVHMESL